MDKMGTFIAGAFYGSLVTFFTMCVAYCFKSSSNENILRQQLEEVAEKHYNECGQIAHYEDENRRMKEQLGDLIKKYESEM